MSVNLPDLYSRQYANTINLLLQQEGSRLRDSVTTGSHKGEGAQAVTQIGKIEMQPRAARFSPMTRVDAVEESRWVYPESFELPQLIDPTDELRMIVDPKGKYVQNALNAAGRQMDRLILSACFSTAKTGKLGTSDTTFPAANVVAVNFGSSGNVGLTVPKLREAKKKLMAYDVDVNREQLYMVITAEQHDDLLQEAQVVSTDFNDKPVLVDGRVQRFLGVNFIHTELVNTDGSGFRRCPMYVKSGLYLGLWQDMKSSIDKRTDLTGIPWQAYIEMTAGATRLEENRVIEVKCSEA
jgi:hypothetical protein